MEWMNRMSCYAPGKDLLNPGMGRMNGFKSSEARSFKLGLLRMRKTRGRPKHKTLNPDKPGKLA